MILSNIEGIIDSHMHFSEMQKKQINIDSFITNWFKKGGSYLIDIGIEENNFASRLELSSKNNKILLSAGIHPNYCTDNLTDRMKLIEEQVKLKNVIAVGETGLDYFRDFTDKDLQKKYFLEHLSLSRKYNKPIIIHNRNASDDILEILENFGSPIKGLIHCFSEGPKHLKRFIDLGLNISFAGNITYKKSTDILESLLITPLEKILIETDSPYLSPQKVRGSINTPGNIGYTLDFICDKLNINRNQLVKTINNNFTNLFGI